MIILVIIMKRVAIILLIRIRIISISASLFDISLFYSPIEKDAL